MLLQPGGIGLLPTVPPTDPLPEHTAAKVYAYISLHARSFLKNRHKTQHMSCTWSIHVCSQNFAVVRRGV